MDCKDGSDEFGCPEVKVEVKARNYETVESAGDYETGESAGASEGDYQAGASADAGDYYYGEYCSLLQSILYLTYLEIFLL
jgi:hypothetical protein